MAFKRPKKKEKNKKIDRDKLFKKLIEDLKKRKLGPFGKKTPEMKPMPYKPGKGRMPKMKPMPYKPGKDKEKMKPVPLAKGGFPDLSGDGKVTKKDILMGRGVIKKRKGGKVTGKSIGPAGASIVSDDGKRIKKSKKKKKGFLGIAIDIIRPKTISAADGGEINGLKKMGMKKGGLAGRLAQRGYGKARK